MKGSDYSWSYQTPPSSPSSTGSRKSSLCRCLTHQINDFFYTTLLVHIFSCCRIHLLVSYFSAKQWIFILDLVVTSSIKGAVCYLLSSLLNIDKSSPNPTTLAETKYPFWVSFEGKEAELLRFRGRARKMLTGLIGLLHRNRTIFLRSLWNIMVITYHLKDYKLLII